MKAKIALLAAGVGVTLLMSAAPASAQDGYLFGMPRTTLTLRAGAAHPAADSEIFRFFTDELTLERADFSSATFGIDVATRVHPQLDVMVSVGIAQSSDESEFRHFTEDDDQPIRQTTKLMRAPVTAGLKLHLLPRGRSLGKLAFIPARFSPYVGGGAGVLWYELQQHGDFVDHETLDIFTDHFESDGATLTANAFAGGDLWIMSRVALNVEARHSWAEADLQDAFSDFERIDLRGWQLTAGISLRY